MSKKAKLVLKLWEITHLEILWDLYTGIMINN